MPIRQIALITGFRCTTIRIAVVTAKAARKKKRRDSGVTGQEFGLIEVRWHAVAFPTDSNIAISQKRCAGILQKTS